MSVVVDQERMKPVDYCFELPSAVGHCNLVMQPCRKLCRFIYPHNFSSKANAQVELDACVQMQLVEVVELATFIFAYLC